MSSLNSLKYRDFVNPYWYDAAREIADDTSFSHGEGCFLLNEQGEQWLDLSAQYGSASLGHNNQFIRERITEYLSSRPVNVQQWGIQQSAGELAERLIRHSSLPNSKAVFCTTGSEAIETSLKLAMVHTGRSRSIAFQDCFHGLTLKAMGLMGRSIWSSGIPMSDQPTPLQFNDTEGWHKELRSGMYAAVVIELIQGIGGGHTWNEVDLGILQEMCAATSTLLIVDEVQTGIGRVGTYFGCSQYRSLKPDMVAVSKGLSAGLVPAAAVLVDDAIHRSLYGRPGCSRIHGSTFSGNGMAVATATAVLDYIDSHDVLAHVNAVAEHFRSCLQALQDRYPCLESFSVNGLLIFIKFRGNTNHLVQYAFQLLFANNILTNFATHRANILKLTPPLILDKEEVDHFISIFSEVLVVLQEVEHENQ